MLLLAALGSFAAGPAQAQAVWSAMLTVKEPPPGNRGCFGSIGDHACTTALDDDDFTVDGTSFDIHELSIVVTQASTKWLTLILSRKIPDAMKELKLCLGTTGFALSDGEIYDDTPANDDNGVRWGSRSVSGIPSWSVGEKVAVSLASSCTQKAGTPGVTLSADNATPVEGATVTVTATLDAAAPSGGVTLSLDPLDSVSKTIYTTATKTDDYTLTPAAISIAAGQTTGTATLEVVDDAVVEDIWYSVAGETVVLEAKSASPELVSKPLVITILDNDGPFAGRRPGQPTLEAVTSGQDAPTDTTLTFNVGCAGGGSRVTDYVLWAENVDDPTEHHSRTVSAPDGQCVTFGPVTLEGLPSRTTETTYRVRVYARNILGFRSPWSDAVLVATTASNDPVTSQDPNADSQGPRVEMSATELDVAVGASATYTVRLPVSARRFRAHQSHGGGRGQGERLAVPALLRRGQLERGAGGHRARRVGRRDRDPPLGPDRGPDLRGGPRAGGDGDGERGLAGDRPRAGGDLAGQPACRADREGPRVARRPLLRRSNPAHTDRWDRVLLALGATVTTTGLTPMTAAEAQGYADRGWTRWAEVAAALRQIENGGKQADDPVPVVSITAGAAVGEGGDATFVLAASPTPAAALTVAVIVSQSGDHAASGATGSRTVTVPAGGTATFTVATVDDGTDEPDGSITAMLGSGAGYTVGDAGSATVAVADDDEPLPNILTRRTIVREGRDAAAVFTVRLDRAAPETVTVDYATADGRHEWAGTLPATAGLDYTAVAGTLAFAAGATLKTVSVPILDDAIDEGTEHFMLRFSNPQGATLGDVHRETQGLIRNEDHLQSAWLSRFGRMAGGHVADAVSGRLEGGLTPGAHATLAGRPVDVSGAEGGKAMTAVMTALAMAWGPREAEAEGPATRGADGLLPDAPAATLAARSLTGRDILAGSSFHVVPEGGHGPAAWGRVSRGAYDGADVDGTDRTTLDGTVTTATLGADVSLGRVLAGLAVSFSDGEGAFESPGADNGRSGSIASRMTTLAPYARLRLGERVTAWGLAGRGTGDMRLRFDDGTDQVRTDLLMRMAAFGARGALLEQGAGSGMDLALKADALFVRTDSEAAANSAATRANASRLRLLLEGSRSFAVSETATLRLAPEIGLRHDGGDAETGTGVEAGLGVTWSDAATGLSAEMRARTLLTHADSDYGEWGMSASVRLDPGERGRGRWFSVTSDVGRAASAAERLWAERSGLAFASPDGTFGPARRLTAEAGYGMPVFGGRFTGTPNAGLGLADGGAREARAGWRLASAVPGDPGFEVNFDALRRALADGGGEAGEIRLAGVIRW